MNNTHVAIKINEKGARQIHEEAVTFKVSGHVAIPFPS